MLFTYYSPAKNAIQRVVDCERCGCQFEYTLNREGIVSGATWKEEDDTEADVAARNQAHIEWMYGNEHDPVPCPECKRYQTAMRPAVEQHYLRRWKLFGLGPPEILLFLGGAMPAVGLLFMGGGPQAAFPFWPLWIAAAILLLAGVAHVGQGILAARYDPERDPRGPTDRGVTIYSGQSAPGGNT